VPVGTVLLSPTGLADLVASARAYVNALNKLLVKREKTAPQSLKGLSASAG